MNKFRELGILNMTLRWQYIKPKKTYLYILDKCDLLYF